MPRASPVILHCREAWPDCLALLERHWRASGLGGIFHCFGGTLEEARQGIAMGFLVSFAGNVTYPKAQNLRDVAGGLPLESLLIETDSPFLAPQGHRGRRNEPAYVAEVAQTLATVRNLAPARDCIAVTAGELSPVLQRPLSLRSIVTQGCLLATGAGHLSLGRS